MVQVAREGRRDWGRDLVRAARGVRVVGVAKWLLTAGAVAAIPLAHEFKILPERRWFPVWAWFALWAIAFLANEGIAWYNRGRIREQAARRLIQIQGSLGGAIDTITDRITAADDRRLSEGASHELCVSVLHRIKDYVAQTFPADEEVRLRVTLAVPLPRRRERGTSKPLKIRIWCYDEPYQDRGWSTFTLGNYAEQADLGCARAFMTGDIQVIDDIELRVPRPKGSLRSFRSVTSIPIRKGGAGGPSIAVVNIDADRPNLFTVRRVEDALNPLLAPALNLLELVLLLRRPGEVYAFRNE